MNVKNISKLLKENFPLLRLLDATIINRYKREYFLSKDKKFRITIDTNQCFTNPRNISTPKKIYLTDPAPIIIELKYNLQWKNEVQKITNALGVRINKNSKYVNSINGLYSHIV